MDRMKKQMEKRLKAAYVFLYEVKSWVKLKEITFIFIWRFVPLF
jgi:hypothetical protein